MSDDPVTAKHPARIEVHVRTVNQLFNSMDPSPFIEKDLDPDAEAFIVSWAREHSRHDDLQLIVHIGEWPIDGHTDVTLQQGISNYFAYRGEMTKREFGQLLRRGRRSAAIGVVFLAVCLGAAHLLSGYGPEPAPFIIRESLIIVGWVAMWRPLEIFLYDWWPLRSAFRLYQRLSGMKVVVRPSGA